MSPWLAAALALVPPLVCAGIVAATRHSNDRLVALQLGSAITIFMLVLFAAGEDQPSFLDLALTLVLLGFPGTLAYAHVLERWL